MRKLAAVLFAGTMLLSACGGDDPQAADDTTPAATEQAPEETGGDTGGDTGGIQAGGNCTDNSKIEGQADLEMQDYQFAPPCLQINADQGLRVHNEGGAAHNLSVEGVAGIDIDVQPGEENNTESTGLSEGTYAMFCKFHRESHQMEGELRVVAA